MLTPEEVKRHLAAQILTLARQVAPDGKVEGREWVGHAVDGAKFGVVIAGPKVGAWQNFHSGAAGRSGLSLIRDAFCGGDHRLAYRWALTWLGEAVHRAPPPVRPVDAHPRAGEPGGPNARAMALWLDGEPFAWERPAGRYLIGREIDPSLFGDRPFGALRYARDIWNNDERRRMPAMLAAVIHPLTHQHLATHRTYLAPRADGEWTKAPVALPKKLLGPGHGGIIPLTRGASGRRYAEARAPEALLLGEGIETVLSVAQWHPEARAVAYVSAGNLVALDLPEAFDRVTLIRDRDGENDAVTRAREETMGHWAREGRQVAVWDPPEGFKDANDWLRGQQTAA